LKPASLPRYNKPTVRRPRKLPLPLPRVTPLLPPTCRHATLRPDSRASTIHWSATTWTFITNVGVGLDALPRHYHHHHALLEATHSIFGTDASCRRETGLVARCSFAQTDPK
jgi:hypothetical protein